MKISSIHSSVALNLFEGLSSRDILRLLSEYKSAERALEAGPEEWGRVLTLPKEISGRLQGNLSKMLDMADSELREADKRGIRIVSQDDPGFPPLLREISDPPPIIYVWGEGGMWGTPAVAIVGSRRCSYYGQKTALELAGELTRRGLVTVSGLARGIDSFVHQATVEENGETWGVLGSGLLEIYPPENKKLAENIKRRGVLISEFPLHTRPFPYHFPRRNRIIAGLSLGCVIVEGDLKSGALITCHLAAEEGREVFAVPGSIHSPLSRGPNYLIKSGAKLVQTAEDIIDELPVWIRGTPEQNINGSEKKYLHLDPIYENILSFIQAEPVHRDIVASKLNRNINEMASILLDMELKGLIDNLPGGLVARR